MSWTILVVEDAPHVQLLIRQALGSVDATVVPAADGDSGWLEINERTPDLVILDLALPGRNGWDVLVQMRANPATAHIPVVVVTAHGQSGMAVEVRKGGADAFLEKPFDPRVLRERVLELLPVA